MSVDVQAVERLLESPPDGSRSLDILDACGIPTVRRVRACGDGEIAAACERLGGALVLKGIVPGVAHKSDLGLVDVGIRGAEEAIARAREMAGAHPSLDGFLLERREPGRRELACGLVRDATFGPAVMLGFGGVHAEVVADRAFRACPVDATDVRGMIGELRTREMLGDWRGDRPADIESLAHVLVALCELGTHVPAVSEIDVNPLVVRSDGSVVAVDALVVAGDQRTA